MLSENQLGTLLDLVREKNRKIKADSKGWLYNTMIRRELEQLDATWKTLYEMREEYRKQIARIKASHYKEDK